MLFWGWAHRYTHLPLRPWDLLFLFLSKQEQTEPLECQLPKVKDAVSSPKITETKGHLNLWLYWILSGAKTMSAVSPFPPSSFSAFFWICFSESSLKRWWAIPEKICLCPPKGTTSTYKPSLPLAGPAASSVSFRSTRSFHLFPLVAHPAILLTTLNCLLLTI